MSASAGSISFIAEQKLLLVNRIVPTSGEPDFSLLEVISGLLTRLTLHWQRSAKARTKASEPK